MIKIPVKLIRGSAMFHKLPKAIIVYNTERPQMALRGSTPNEVFSGKAIRLSDYKPAFKVQRKTRMQKHKKSACQKCRNKA